ncbi:MAG TPA: sugar transferase [Streptosporangiaceae bacterium]|nr:sugar transferase [Streptosporangiaceae bacterium]
MTSHSVRRPPGAPWPRPAGGAAAQARTAHRGNLPRQDVPPGQGYRTDSRLRAAGGLPSPAPAAGNPRPLRPGKRLFDVVVASACLILLSPLLAAVAVLVRVTTPGPALFRQVRLGRDRRPFVLYKFRSMYAGSTDDVHREYIRRLLTEEQPPPGGRRGLYKLEDDARITPLGKLLRRTSIDELPQLVNVIRGDMSLVGPRPLLPWEAELIGEEHSLRFLVRPGLTGLWQVSGRNRLTLRQGLSLDLEYVRTQGFALDLAILLRTVPAVLSARGAR